jgi:hypothetical protein
MGILCPVILPETCVVPPRNTKFAQRRAVRSELIGRDGGWSDALLLQEFSHQLKRRLAVSPWLNEDVQDLPLMETNTSSRCHRPSGRGRPRLSLRAMIPPNFKAQRRTVS